MFVCCSSRRSVFCSFPGTVFQGAIFLRGKFRGRNFSRIELKPLQTTKMELFLTIFNCQKPSTFITDSFIQMSQASYMHILVNVSIIYKNPKFGTKILWILQWQSKGFLFFQFLPKTLQGFLVSDLTHFMPLVSFNTP